MRTIKGIICAVLLGPLAAIASGPELHLDKAPDKAKDNAALQHGAKIFINYCLNCHSASYMRYNRLKDIGLSEAQIKDNLLFTAEKVGEAMKASMRQAESKAWFGASPPDLTIIARSRASEFGSGADWLYTYLRQFYRDETRPTGWNNVVFENVGMPHALWELQGSRPFKTEEVRAKHEKESAKVVGYEKVTILFDESGRRSEKVEPLAGLDHHAGKKLEFGPTQGGTLSQAEYDAMIADLVGFLVYMGEPAAEWRKQLGVYVLIALGILAVLAYALKREYWKDVH